MKDSHNREMKYLRVSVTDRCNLRCTYCMPEEGVKSIPHEDILRYNEIERIVKVMAELGISRVRLTGGEPLVRKGVVPLARNIKKISGISYLALTTNGILLGEMAEKLLEAGVNGLNISLDTADPLRYEMFTRRNQFKEAVNGIETALRLPFDSVKVNCVLSPDSIDADWLGVIALAKDTRADIRLIEWMPLSGVERGGAATAAYALDKIEKAFGGLEPVAINSERYGGPAVYYKIAGMQGKIGVINAMSHCFCERCDRLRLTSDGDLKLCLFYDQGISLRDVLRGGISDGELKTLISETVLQKPGGHRGKRGRQESVCGTPLVLSSSKTMSGIGG